MKKTKLILPLLLVSVLASCNTISGEWRSVVASNADIVTTANTNVDPFNTVMQLSYFLNDDYANTNEKTFENVTKIYKETIADLHKKFDRHYYYKNNNDDGLVINVKTINDSYGTGKEIKCSEELYQLLKLGVECYELTNGQFNIFTGAITDYWDEVFGKAYNYEPLDDIDPYFNEFQKETLETLVDSIPSNIDEINQQLTFNDENMSVIFNNCDFNNGLKPLISVGGIGKGLATDLVKKELVSNGYKDGYLLSGGSSITTLSTPIFTRKEKGHKISVVNPAKTNLIEKEVAFSIKFTEEFNFSTSGNYTANKSYTFIDENDKIVYRHHIINPFTGYPESYYRSVSIMTHYFSSAQVDALSTAFMNLKLEDGLKLRKEILNKYPEADLELFYISQEGSNKEAKVTVTATSSMNDTLTVAKGVNLIYEE